MTVPNKVYHRLYRVVSSPFDEDDDLPWEYDEDGLIDWVDEVFCEGYKDDEPCTLEVDDCLELLEGAGYEVEVDSVEQ